MSSDANDWKFLKHSLIIVDRLTGCTVVLREGGPSPCLCTGERGFGPTWDPITGETCGLRPARLGDLQRLPPLSSAIPFLIPDVGSSCATGGVTSFNGQLYVTDTYGTGKFSNDDCTQQVHPLLIVNPDLEPWNYFPYLVPASAPIGVVKGISTPAVLGEFLYFIVYRDRELVGFRYYRFREAELWRLTPGGDVALHKPAFDPAPMGTFGIYRGGDDRLHAIVGGAAPGVFAIVSTSVDFSWGPKFELQDVVGQVVDVAVAQDGTMYVQTHDANEDYFLWRVTPEGTLVGGTCLASWSHRADRPNQNHAIVMD